MKDYSKQSFLKMKDNPKEDIFCFVSILLLIYVLLLNLI